MPSCIVIVVAIGGVSGSAVMCIDIVDGSMCCQVVFVFGMVILDQLRNIVSLWCCVVL